MTNRELREKYGDFTKNNYFEYPMHFFSPWDDFTMHIPNWKNYFSRFEGHENLNFLELGTAQGRSAVWLLENILVNDTDKLTTIDPNRYAKVTQEKVKKRLDDNDKDLIIDSYGNIAPYIEKNKCIYVQSTSDDFFKQNKELFDFVYIDACHDPDQVLRDAINSFDVCKPNGLMLFDDYFWHECGVGIQSFLNAFKSKINILHKEYQVLVEKI